MIRIHADYDHNGRLTRQSADYDQRGRLPGALVLPNIDADGRSLPGNATAVPRLPLLDYEQTARSAADNDLLEFQVELTTWPLAAGAQVRLSFSAQNGQHVRIFDARRHWVAPLPISGPDKQYPLNLSSARSSFFLELRSFAESPELPLASNLPFQADLRIRAEVLDANAAVIGSDEGHFFVCPLILVGDTATPERLYMAAVPQNTSCVRDVETSMRSTGIPMLQIPESVNLGDTWLQDQFQVAYAYNATNKQNVIFHLPRLRSGSRPAAPGSNLVNFVNTHFPARDLGVFKDFWNREIEFQDINGQSIRVGFVETEQISRLLDQFSRLRQALLDVLHSLDRRAFNQIVAQRSGGFMSDRSGLSNLHDQAQAALSRARGAAEREHARDQYQAWADAIRTQFRAFDTALPLNTTSPRSVSFRITRSNGSTLVLTVGDFTADHVEETISQLHSSLNYGGNIEVSPPQTAAPFGKIVIGALAPFDRIPLDESLVNFLNDQRVQPLVKINTSWLEVGHVDEVMTFVPSSYGSSGHAILRASPGLAQNILYEARQLFISGMNWALSREFDPYFSSTGYYARHTDRGEHPVTHLLRGRSWPHVQRAEQDASSVILPPRIYRSMVDFRVRSLDPLPYQPGVGGDRQYPAHLSVFEATFFDYRTNSCIENILLAARPTTPRSDTDASGETTTVSPDAQVQESFDYCSIGAQPSSGETAGGSGVQGMVENIVHALERMREAQELRNFLDGNRLDDIMGREFPGVPILPLPVLFDRLDSWTQGGTMAFTPDLVNMQILGRHVLVPRPYGPRMSAADTVTVLQAAMAEMDPAFLRPLNERWLNAPSRGLNRTWHWAYGGTAQAPEQVTLSEIARQFRDGFPRGTDVEQRILRANASAFSNDELRRGWHKLSIPEDKIDLFEAASQLILEGIGLQVHWVDSWYYHTHSGGIHCGTNVLRRVQPDRRNAWWNHRRDTI